MRKPGLALIFGLLSCLLLGACGAERGRAPAISTTAATPEKFDTYRQPGDDLSFPYPSDWYLEEREAPGVATVASGGAEFTVWAYRTKVTILDRPSAERALQRVLASLKERDPGFAVESTAIVARLGAPGLEIIGTTTINGRAVKIRSTHLFRDEGEYVVDQISDPGQFTRLNEEVFEPMLATFVFLGNPPIARKEAEGG